MASNGESKKGEEKASDTVMVDAAPSDSPFALLHQPKVELFDAISAPATTNVSKPRFEPKVKPRGGAQAKARAAAAAASKPAPPPPQAEQVPSPNPNPNAPPNPVTVEQLKKPKEESAAQLAAALNGGNVNIKLEPAVPSVNVKTEAVPQVKVESDSVVPDVEMREADSSPGVEQTSSRQEGGDHVVREIDVFLSKSVDPDTQFYLLQYPLRPAWRPYALEEMCQEVRLKAKQKKVEVDLAIDTDSENYDQEAAEHLQIKTQTLSSSKVSLTTSYAIGVLQGNKLHLNPLQAVVQLRPSMKYLDEADAKKKTHASASGVDGDEDMADAEAPEAATPELVALQVNVRRRETEWQEENRLHSHAYLKQIDDAEPWIPLEPHGVDSPVTDGVRHQMIASTSSQIPFKLRRDQYVNKLVPSQGILSPSEVRIGDGCGSAGFSRSFLDTLPLEKRFHLLLSKGRVHVLQFERLMKLAPHDCTEQEVLAVLQEKAVLVQGCWVVASNLRYSKPVTIIRDYLLLLFTKSRVVQHSQLENLRISKDILREILLSFAVQSGVTASWEFQESTDRSFIKRHQVVVKEQAQRWAEVEGHLRDSVRGLELTGTKVSGTPKIDLSTVKEVSASKKKLPGSQVVKSPLGEKPKGVHFNLAADGSGGPGQGPPTKALSGQTSLSEATLAALPRALNKIFSKHSVCRMQFICQTLRQMAIVAAGASKDPQAVGEAKAAAQAAAAPLPELEAAVSTVASNIDGVYFLTSLGNPYLDPFRNVVIALLRAKGSGSGLRKTDIMEASKIALKTEVPQATYQKVLKELCYTKGGAWVLKPGDGRPT
ncbi:unnamed protein product [Calypogeia fissa]